MAMKVLNIFCCFLLFSCISARRYEEYKKFLVSQSENETFVKLFAEHAQNFQDADNKNLKRLEFPCKAAKNYQKAATNVHELTPYDVKVVGAIGDSITAGTGIKAKTIIGLLTQDRGLSWSGGGDGTTDDHITLPNMLKVFNPELIGFSNGIGTYKWKNSHLNIANPGDEASNMPYQARKLVDRMKSGKEGVDFENDWKVITLFIGGNDLCAYCDDRTFYSAEKYIGYIREALDIFHAEVPKAFINVVEVLDIGFVPLLNEGLICDTLHFFLCRCGAFPGANKEELEEYVHAYQKGTRDLINSGRYDTRDDFTVVDQPFFSETPIPTKEDGSVDLGYFSPDCFHLSELGQQSAAYALWDNMIEPVGQKRTSWTPSVPVECPSEDAPYFYTKKNSPPMPQEGSFYDNAKPSDSLQNGGNDDKGNLSGTTIAVICVGIFCLVAVISGTAYFIKRRRNSSYTKI